MKGDSRFDGSINNQNSYLKEHPGAFSLVFKDKDKDKRKQKRKKVEIGRSKEEVFFYQIPDAKKQLEKVMESLKKSFPWHDENVKVNQSIMEKDEKPDSLS